MLDSGALPDTPLNGLGEPVMRSQGPPPKPKLSRRPERQPKRDSVIRGDGKAIGSGRRLKLDDDTPMETGTRAPSIDQALEICREYLFNRHQAAKYARVAPKTIQYWVKKCDLPVTIFGRNGYIRRDHLDDILLNRGGTNEL